MIADTSYRRPKIKMNATFMIECTKQTDRKSKTFFNIGEYSFCPNEVPFLHLHLQISALGNKQTAKKAGNLENVMRFL